jgi:hypothetical protein
VLAAIPSLQQSDGRLILQIRDTGRDALAGFLGKVAILGSPDFDVLDVDPATLAFGPNGAAPAREVRPRHRRDVNGDDALDLVVRFRYGETGLPLGESQACLVGVAGGHPFEGCDAVNVFSPDLPRMRAPMRSSARTSPPR